MFTPRRRESGGPEWRVHEGLREHVPSISLPQFSALNVLIPHAAAGLLSLTAPENDTINTIKMRLEFMSMDLNGDGDSTDVNEGFVRVYVADTGDPAWFVAITAMTIVASVFDRPGRQRPYGILPVGRSCADVGDDPAVGGGHDHGRAAADQEYGFLRLMGEPTSRCYPGGDPRLMPVARMNAPGT